jgi:hypothetical protein
VLKKKIKEFQAAREYTNISQLISTTAQAERNKIAKLLDSQIDHTRIDCGLTCIAHKQVQFIKDLKD